MLRFVSVYSLIMTMYSNAAHCWHYPDDLRWLHVSFNMADMLLRAITGLAGTLAPLQIRYPLDG